MLPIRRRPFLRQLQGKAIQMEPLGQFLSGKPLL